MIWRMVRIIMEEKSSGFDDVPLFDPPVDRIGVRTARVRYPDVCRSGGGQMHD